MFKRRWIGVALISCVMFVTLAGSALGQTDEIVDVQKYNRAIQIMAMLLLGFGFLMAYIRGYGRSALTATLLLVAVAIPLYIMIKSTGVFGEAVSDIDSLIMAEFAAASLLICAGAVLGRLKMPQYMLLALLFVPIYMVNEWIILEGGLGLVNAGRVVDVGGSIVIHAFGAFFGLGVIMIMTTKKEYAFKIPADENSEKFSLLGTMMLWVFWPSFCAALVIPELVPHTGVNVILALCGSTLATYFTSVTLHKKFAIPDIANATLAGGVAIGATCVAASYEQAITIGVLAGVLSTYGYAAVQPLLQKQLKGIDTCGVSNLHGFPGVMGGLAAIFVIAGLDMDAQLSAIGITVGLAIGAGYAVGTVLSFLGPKLLPYEDSEEMLEE